MERDELMQLLAGLRGDGTDSAREELITQIGEGINSVFDDTDRLRSSNGEYIRANEQLRAANMKLFMQIGEAPKENPNEKEDGEQKKLTFEDLFKEEK